MLIKKLQSINSLRIEEVLGIEELSMKVKATFENSKMILYGSKARGDFTEQSDTDLLVIVEAEDSVTNMHLLSEILFEINFKYDTNISAILESNSKWRDSDYLSLPFPSTIVEEGIVRLCV
jgi:predicted nucleotidyltransferase